MCSVFAKADPAAVESIDGKIQLRPQQGVVWNNFSGVLGEGGGSVMGLNIVETSGACAAAVNAR